MNIDKVVENPSYNQNLSIRERISDFLGKYYINLNGVVPNNHPEITSKHKQEVIDFVEEITKQTLTNQKKEIRGEIEKMKKPRVIKMNGGREIVDNTASIIYNQALQDILNLKSLEL